MSIEISRADVRIPAWLGLNDWVYDDFFDPKIDLKLHRVVSEVETTVSEAQLNKHQFFQLAATSKTALNMWVAQELVMTNSFSQLVLFASSHIQNVHARAILAEIAFGEHGRAKNGFAKRAHPWLLERLRASIDLPRSAVSPAKPTIDFISRLAAGVADPLVSVAYIGVGNERLIEPEYTAIEHCFHALVPQCDFAPFLHANLNEDVAHSALCYELASILIKTDSDAEIFLHASKDSIASRVTYFDDLLRLCDETNESQ